MTIFFNQNDVILVKISSVWTIKVVIWWLFDDNLRARKQEPEKEETTNSAPKMATLKSGIDN